MHMKRFSPLLIITGFLVTTGVAYACSCVISTPAERYDRAEVILSGTVTGINDRSLSQYLDHTVKVSKTWKGTAGSEVVITSHESSATCGFNFEKGQEYLIYATKTENGLETNLCSGTALLQYAKEDLDYLDSRSDPGFSCQPYVCLDGTTHPRCSADGHVINYFQDPCQGKGELPFTDVPSTHPQVKAIAFAKLQGIIQGYADGTFKPKSRINRAEFVTMISRSVSTEEQRFCHDNFSAPFSDIQPGHWYMEHLCYSFDAGIIQGYPDGTFRPAADISMAEAAKIIILGQKIQVKTNPLALEAWWQTYIRTLREHKALPASYQTPEQKITRGDVAEILWKLDLAKSD